MISLPRIFIGLGLYTAYLIALSFLTKGNMTLYIVLFALGSGAFLLAAFSGWMLTSPKYRRLLKRGRDAAATVLEIRDTGVTLNKNPYVRLRLRVLPPDGAPYEAETRALVSRVSIPRVGDTVAVKYDPEKPGDVIAV